MSIKISELRVNNWYESVKWKQAVMCDISDIVQIYYNADGAKPDEDHVAMVFKPIPLTEDWLLKLGFTETWGDLQSRKEFSIVNFYVYHYKKGKTESVKYETHTDLKIKYVHQLQNLYFALTGTELTLTDKVE